MVLVFFGRSENQPCKRQTHLEIINATGFGLCSPWGRSLSAAGAPSVRPGRGTAVPTAVGVLAVAWRSMKKKKSRKVFVSSQAWRHGSDFGPKTSTGNFAPRRQPAVRQQNPRKGRAPGNVSPPEDPCRFRVSGAVARDIPASASRHPDGDLARIKTRAFLSKFKASREERDRARELQIAASPRPARANPRRASLTHMLILDCSSSGSRGSSSEDVRLPYSNIAVVFFFLDTRELRAI